MLNHKVKKTVTQNILSGWQITESHSVIYRTHVNLEASFAFIIFSDLVSLLKSENILIPSYAQVSIEKTDILITWEDSRFVYSMEEVTNFLTDSKKENTNA